MTTKRTSIAVAALAVLAACGSAPVDPEAALESVHATEQAQLQAIAAKDLRGAVRNYEDGAILVTPGQPPATGGEAIAAAFDEMLSDPNLKFEVTSGPGWVSEGGDMAVTTSTVLYTSSEPGTGNPVQVKIGNQTVWRKPTGKPWQIVTDYNVALPEAQQVANAAE